MYGALQVVHQRVYVHLTKLRCLSMPTPTKFEVGDVAVYDVNIPDINERFNGTLVVITKILENEMVRFRVMGAVDWSVFGDGQNVEHAKFLRLVAR